MSFRCIYLGFSGLICSLVIAQFDWPEGGYVLGSGNHVRWYRTADTGNPGEYIIAWSDMRNGDYDVYLQKISSSGELLWGENGIPAALAPGDQKDPQLLSDGYGGVYVAWRDFAARHDRADLFVQHVNDQGIAAWDIRGRALTELPGIQGGLILNNAPGGGAVAAWIDSSLCGSRPIYTTWITDNGPENEGVGTYTACASSVCNLSIIALTADESVVTWRTYDFDYSPVRYKLHTQKVNLSGELLWADGDEEGYILRNTENRLGSVKAERLDDDYWVMLWKEDNQNYLYRPKLQVLDCDAAPQLTYYGIFLDNTPDLTDFYEDIIISDENIWAIWENDDDELFCQGYRMGTGLLLDPGSGLIADSPGDKMMLNAAPDGTGGFLFQWLTSDDQSAQVHHQHLAGSGEFSFPVDGALLTEIPDDFWGVTSVNSGSDAGLVLWFEQLSSGGEIKGSLYSLNPPEPVVEGAVLVTNEVRYLDNPVFVAQDDGPNLLIWREEQGYPEELHYYAANITEEFNPQGPYSELPELGDEISAVQVGNSIFTAFWYPDEWGSPVLHYQVFTSDFQPLFPEPQAVGQTTVEYPWQYDFQLTSDEQDNVYLAWAEYDYDSFFPVIWLTSYDSFGNERWTRNLVMADDDTYDCSVEQILPRTAGGCWLLFKGGPWYSQSLFIASWTDEGEPPESWANQVTEVSFEGIQVYDGVGEICPDGVFICWKSWRNDEVEIIGNLVTNAGTVYPQNQVSLSNEFAKAGDAAMAFSSAVGDISICWNEMEDNYSGIYCRSVQPLNSVPGPVTEVARVDEWDAWLCFPDVVRSDYGNTLVVWQHNCDQTEADIRFQEFPGLDQPAVYPHGGISVCSQSYPQQYPQIRRYSSQPSRWFIYWEDQRYSESIGIHSYSPEINCGHGDLNSNGTTDILDLIIGVDFILNGSEPVSILLCALDADGDGSADVQDLILIVQQILGGI